MLDFHLTKFPTMADLFARTSGPRDATIAIVGESEGSEEARAGQPFVGAAGQLLNELLEHTGIPRDSCFVTNVVAARPPENDMQAFFEPGDPTLGGLRPSAQVLEGLSVLNAQLDTVAPKLVLALGNYALWALTRHAGSAADGPRPRVPNGIMDWRGSQVYRLASDRTAAVHSGIDGHTPVLPLVHPAAILRDWSQRFVALHDLRTRVPLALAGKWAASDRDPPLALEALTSFERAYATLAALLSTADVRAAAGQRLLLAGDIETWRASLITCFGVATSDVRAYSLPFVRIKPTRDGVVSFWPVEQESLLLVLLCKLIAHPAVEWIGQNFLYDRAFLWEWWQVEPHMAWDTMYAQHLLLPGTQKDLRYLSSLYCRHFTNWKVENRDWNLDEAGMGLETHLLYNAQDCCRTFEVAVQQRLALFEVQPDRNESPPQGRLMLWAQRELPKIELAWTMQKRGVAVDRIARNALALDLVEAREALGAWLEAIAPQALLDAEGVTPKSGTPWRNSPRQTAVLLFEVLGLQVQRNRKSGSVSTDDEALKTLSERYPRLSAFFAAVLEYRSLGVLFSTFVESRLDWRGRFVTSFNPAGTITLRYSSSMTPLRLGGNAQNVPGSEEV